MPESKENSERRKTMLHQSELSSLIWKKSQLEKNGWFEKDGNMLKFSPPTKACPWLSIDAMPLSQDDYCCWEELYEVDPDAFDTFEEYAELMGLARLYAQNV
jgi:hypothetical protein